MSWRTKTSDSVLGLSFEINQGGRMAFGNKTGLEQNLSEDRRARSRRGSDRMNRLSGRSLALLALAVAVAGMGSPATALGATGSQTFTTAGENVFTVPPGVSSVQVQLIGGAGIQADGDALGGPGAIATATLRVVPGQTVFAEVGGGPQDTPLGPGVTAVNGGGASGGAYSGAGGGASDVRTCSTDPSNPLNPVGCGSLGTLASRLVVAGGGGGGGGQIDKMAAGGAGGAADGGAGSDGLTDGLSDTPGTGALPATQSAGGAAGMNSMPAGPATAGQLGVGGAGGDTYLGSSAGAGGGGGGGGLYGGGGGGGGLDNDGNSPYPGGGGGGGGSSGIPSGVTSVSGFSASVDSLDAVPAVAFTWTLPAPTVATAPASSVSMTAATLNGSVDPNGFQVSDCHFELSPAPPAGAVVPCAQQVGAGGSPVAVSAVVTGLTRGTGYTYDLLATNAHGTITAGPSTFQTAGTPTTGAPPGAPGPIKLTDLRQTATRWREGSRRAGISALTDATRRRTRSPLGTTFGFRLNESAAVRMNFTQTASGRRVGNRCLAYTARLQRARPCKRTFVAGTLTFTGHAGSNFVRFQGALSATRKLRLGRHKLVVTASTSRSRSTESIVFTIVKY